MKTERVSSEPKYSKYSGQSYHQVPFLGKDTYSQERYISEYASGRRTSLKKHKHKPMNEPINLGMYGLGKDDLAKTHQAKVSRNNNQSMNHRGLSNEPTQISKLV